MCSELVTKSSPCDDTQPYLHRIIALLKSTDSATAVETSRCVLFNWIRNVIKTSSCHLKIATYYFNISNGMHLKFHGNCLLCIGLQRIKFSQLFKINICLIKVVTNLFYIPLWHHVYHYCTHFCYSTGWFAVKRPLLVRFLSVHRVPHG